MITAICGICLVFKTCELTSSKTRVNYALKVHKETCQYYDKNKKTRLNAPDCKICGGRNPKTEEINK